MTGEQGSRREYAVTRRDLLRAGAMFGPSLVLARCGGDDSAPSEPRGARFQTPKTKPDKLVVRSWGDPWSEGIQESAGNAFTADTGIEIEFDTSDIGEIQTKVQQAIDAGQRPPVDVVYTIATVTVVREERDCPRGIGKGSRWLTRLLDPSTNGSGQPRTA